MSNNKNKNVNKGFIQIPILIFIVISLLTTSGVGYFVYSKKVSSFNLNNFVTIQPTETSSSSPTSTPIILGIKAKRDNVVKITSSPTVLPIFTTNPRVQEIVTSLHSTSLPSNSVIERTPTYPIQLCLTPSSANKPTINFYETVVFDASCSHNLDKNPSVNFTWNFRDGDLNTYTTKGGQSVSHSFSKFAKNFNSAACNDSFHRGFEVELCTEGGCLIHHYCPTETDPVVVDLRNCIKNSSGQKNVDQCITELNL